MDYVMKIYSTHISLLWCHHGHSGVSNHPPHNCLINRYSGADQGKHQNSSSLAFVWGIQRWLVNSPHKWPVTRKMVPFDHVIMQFILVHDTQCILLNIYDFEYIYPDQTIWLKKAKLISQNIAAVLVANEDAIANRLIATHQIWCKPKFTLIVNWRRHCIFFFIKSHQPLSP